MSHNPNGTSRRSRSPGRAGMLQGRPLRHRIQCSPRGVPLGLQGVAGRRRRETSPAPQVPVEVTGPATGADRCTVSGSGPGYDHRPDDGCQGHQPPRRKRRWPLLGVRDRGLGTPANATRAGRQARRGGRCESHCERARGLLADICAYVKAGNRTRMRAG